MNTELTIFKENPISETDQVFGTLGRKQLLETDTWVLSQKEKRKSRQLNALRFETKPI